MGVPPKLHDKPHWIDKAWVDAGMGAKSRVALAFIAGHAYPCCPWAYTKQESTGYSAA